MECSGIHTPSNGHVGNKRLVVEKLGYCTSPFVKHAREEMAPTGWAFFPQRRPSVCPMFTTRELLGIYPSGCPAFKSPLWWASFCSNESCWQPGAGGVGAERLDLSGRIEAFACSTVPSSR